jgi:hypothetical protein
MRVKYVETRPEYIHATTTRNSAYSQSRHTKATNDFLDRRFLSEKIQDNFSRFFATLEAIPLLAFGKREECGINDFRDCGLPNGTHMLAYHVEERAAGVFKKMPAVRDLNGLGRTLRRRFAIAGSTISGDKFNARMIPQPSRTRIALAIRQKRHNAPPLKIADHSPIPATSAPSPIVDSNSSKRSNGTHGAPPNRPQQRVFAHRNGQTRRKAMAWPAAQREAETMDYTVHSGRSPGRWQRNRLIEPLAKYLPRAPRFNAPEPSDLDIDLNDPAVRRQIGQPAPISAVDPTRICAAFWARRRSGLRTRERDDLFRADLHTIDDKASRC